MKYITVSELKEKLNQSEPKVEVIDIREEYEYEDDNCGWKNIPMAQILPRVNEIPKDKEVVFVCISGKKASAIDPDPRNIAMRMSLKYPEILLIKV